jgi:hypothetical protein
VAIETPENLLGTIVLAVARDGVPQVAKDNRLRDVRAFSPRKTIACATSERSVVAVVTRVLRPALTWARRHAIGGGVGLRCGGCESTHTSLETTLRAHAVLLCVAAGWALSQQQVRHRPPGVSEPGTAGGERPGRCTLPCTSFLETPPFSKSMSTMTGLGWSERGGCSRFESLFISRVATMAKTMLALLPLLLLGAACAEPVNLHGGNWDELVVSSGRNAFVKFYAPWYGRWP